MTLDERNTYLPVMKSLVKVMETNYPALEDANTLLVLLRDLAKGFLKVKGELTFTRTLERTKRLLTSSGAG